MNIAEILTEKIFREWLRLFDDCAIIGIAGYPNKCPLARFLSATCPIPHDCYYLVFDECIEVQRGDLTIVEQVDLPLWARVIVSKVDAKDIGYPIRKGELLCYTPIQG